MAYYVNKLDEEDINNGAAPISTGASSGLISTGTGAQTTGEKSPGNFVGIQQYLAQNKPQTENLANKMADTAISAGKEASSTINKQGADFTSKVNESLVPWDQNIVDQASTDPTMVANDAGSLAKFQAMRDSSYKGPQSFESTDYYTKANEAANKAQSTSGLLGSEEGQKQVLSGLQGQRNLNKGALTLDSALLSTNPNSAKTLAAAQQSTSGLGQQVQNIGTAGNKQADYVKSETQKMKDAIQSAFSGANSPQAKMEAGINARLAAAQGNITTAEDLNKGSLSNKQYANLGVNSQQLANLNVNKDNLGRFVKGGGTREALSVGNIGTADEYARQAALNSLMGVNNQFLSTPDQAGKANLSSGRFDIESAIAESNAANIAQAAAAKDAQDKLSPTYGNTDSAKIFKPGVSSSTPNGSLNPGDIGYGFTNPGVTAAPKTQTPEALATAKASIPDLGGRPQNQGQDVGRFLQELGAWNTQNAAWKASESARLDSEYAATNQAAPITTNSNAQQLAAAKAAVPPGPGYDAEIVRLDRLYSGI